MRCRGRAAPRCGRPAKLTLDFWTVGRNFAPLPVGNTGSQKKGRNKMKSMLGAAVVFLALATGCATTSDIKKETDPLADRLAKAESRLGALETKQGSLESDLQAAKKSGGADADRAVAAANAAEAAAAKADTCAQKCQKAFELHQRK